MRLALFSDVHANLEALTATLDDIETGACDRVVCLGDVVGYGADPQSCIERIRARADEVLLGNHDQAAIVDEADVGFNEIARLAVRWTRDQLPAESRAYLASRPHAVLESSVLLAHAHPVHTGTWPYVFAGTPIADVFEETDAELMAIGHTHTPGVGNDGEAMLVGLGEGKLLLEPDVRYLFNVGSVGQPRDGDARAAWGLVDLEARTFEIRRVAYDVAGAQAKIIDAGLPPFLAERLARGM